MKTPEEAEAIYRREAKKAPDLTTLYIRRRGMSKDSVEHAVYDAEITERTTATNIWVAKVALVVSLVSVFVSIVALFIKRG